jgi:four helix bundle protein
MARSGFNEWYAWQKGFRLANSISKLARNRFPREEKYSLTDQVLRSSRATCANMAEAFGKRRYPKHFVSKLTDAMSENFETQNWLQFAHAEGYIDEVTLNAYLDSSEEVGKLLNYMEHNSHQFTQQKSA